MIGQRLQVQYAPDTGGGPADLVLGTLPEEENEDSQSVNPWSDIELVDEDSSANVPVELAGKTTSELLAEIEKRDAALHAAETRVDPMANLASQFGALADQLKPKQAAAVDGYRVAKQPQQQFSPADIDRMNKQLAEKFLDDPAGATREVIGRELGPMLSTMAESQAQLSRELVIMNPETRDIYKRYANEIEAEVSEVDALTKLRNPKIYMLAVEHAKARHFSELVEETTVAQQEALAAKYFGVDVETLRKMKTAPGKAPVATPAGSTLASGGRVSPAPASTLKTRIVTTPENRMKIESFAKARGVSPEAAAAHLRARGEI